MATKSGQQEPEKAEVVEELLDSLDTALDRVKVLYEQYFLGIQKQPPSYLHTDVERQIRDIAQRQVRNTALRYRFVTLQQKFGAYNAYWRRTLRQIESGTYTRNLSKIGRQAARTGASVPEEILAAMPKRMREQVQRDREAALALARLRDPQRVDDADLLTLADEDIDIDLEDLEPAALIRESNELRRDVLTAVAAHRIDEADADFDLDAYFTSMTSEGEPDLEASTPVFLPRTRTAPRPPPDTEPAGHPRPALVSGPLAAAIPEAVRLPSRSAPGPGLVFARPPSPGAPGANRPPTGQPTAEPPGANRPPTGQPTAEPPGASRSPTGQPTADAPGASRPPTGSPTEALPTAPQIGVRVPPSRPTPAKGAVTQALPRPPRLPPPVPATSAAQPPSLEVGRAGVAGQPPARDANLPSSLEAAAAAPAASKPPVQAGPLPSVIKPPVQADPLPSVIKPPVQADPLPSVIKPPVQADPLPSVTPAMPAQPLPPDAGNPPVRAFARPVTPPPVKPVMPAQPLPPDAVNSPLRAFARPVTPPPVKPPVLAPSQTTRPNPVVPGAAAARVPTAVETMAGPFPRIPSPPASQDRRRTDAVAVPVTVEPKESSGAAPAAATGKTEEPPRATTPPLPLMPGRAPLRERTPPPERVPPSERTPPPERAPAGDRQAPQRSPVRASPDDRGAPRSVQAPPPGVSEADVHALYASYVKAKAVLGEDAGPGAYGKLLKTIHAQAPKIMEQYNATGVDFSVVVKDNQVIIRAKPKP